MVMGELPVETELLVIGGGPGGYAAAFRAADLGLDVTLVNDEPRLGGVCLLRGCIPSKALLHLARLIHEARESEAMGLRFAAPGIDIEAIGKWRDGVVARLSDGLTTLCRRRDVQLIRGRARFDGSQVVRLEHSDVAAVRFRHAIIATGSRPRPLPNHRFGADSRIMDSTAALALTGIPERLLVVGGGYIGLEMGMAYESLGSRVTLVHSRERLLPAVDEDLLAPLARRVRERFEAVHYNTRVVELKEKEDGVEIVLGGEREESVEFDRVLVGIGREPNTDDLNLESTGVELAGDGSIVVDDQRRSKDPAIYAVGDAAGGLQLAHKAMHEGRVAAEAIAGKASAFEPRAIPAVVYTDPQIAWCGVTEQEAKAQGREHRVERFPWRASGRALTMGADEGMTKIISDKKTGRVLGAGIVGRDAESLIAEGVLAVEMGAVTDDLALTIHPHPTLSETLGETAELFTGASTHFIGGHSMGHRAKKEER